MIEIGKLAPADREAWEAHFRAYIDFYKRDEPQEMYDTAWSAFQEDTRVHALGARIDGELVGFTHFFAHPNTSGPDVCYLQDLFTDARARRKGVGEALIAAVVEWAEKRGCSRVYWSTHETNATARSLYDRVADYRGFIRYQIELPR